MRSATLCHYTGILLLFASLKSFCSRLPKIIRLAEAAGKSGIAKRSSDLLCWFIVGECWWFVSEHLRSINVPTFISVRFRTTSYFMLFPFISIFPKAISNAWVFSIHPWPRGCAGCAMAALALVHLFCFVRLLNGLGQLTRPMKLPNCVAFLIFNAKLGIFRFSTSLAFRCEAALESQGSSSRQRIEGLEKTLQVPWTHVCQFKWIQVVLQESHRFFSRNSKQGDEGSINQSIRHMLWQAHLSKDLLESVRSAWIPAIRIHFRWANALI